jgi:hypothetical protein
MALSTMGIDADRIAAIGEELFELDDAFVSRVREPGAWSRKEILGHLIDSASVNHQRIIESQITDSIVFTGYKHEDWVRLQGYNASDWEDLVTLWVSYNIRLCEIVEQIPLDVLDKEHSEHSYDRTAFREIPASEPATLGYLIEDYFAHLLYHMEQILDS